MIDARKKLVDFQKVYDEEGPKLSVADHVLDVFQELEVLEARIKDLEGKEKK